MINISSTITIDEGDLQLEFIQASGAGGQNVNKVASAVQLRLDVNKVALPADVRRRLGQVAGKRLTKAGILIIEARRFREQERNRQDALDRLVALMRKAAEKPKPRHKTKPTAAAKERRLKSKKRRSETKRRRHSVTHVDE